MLKILLYGYSYGVRSSRKLERALYHNLSFIWLAGGLKPDFKTISRFRRDHRPALQQVLKQCARLCLKLGVVAGNTLFVDGTKLRANASLDRTLTAEQCQKQSEQLEQRIEQILRECETTDAQEAEGDSLVRLQEDLADARGRQAKIQAALETLKAEDRPRINTTDPDCARMHGRQGTHAGYNAQIVVDNEHGLIVASDVVHDNNDRQQFAAQITAAQDTLGQPCQTAGADSGYYNGKKIEAMAAVAEQVLVPARGQVHPSKTKPFAKARFTYVAAEDVYVCPAGKHLPCRRSCPERGYREYQLDGGTCCACEHYAQCTRGRNGRKVIRFFNEDRRDDLRRQFEQPAARAVYARRKQTVELPFGHLKRNVGVDSFLLRGLAGVRAEMSLLASGFNLVRLIGLFGVRDLLARLRTR